MHHFVNSLRKETISYRVSAQQIDDLARVSNVQFENLEANANIRVFQIPRPRAIHHNSIDGLALSTPRAQSHSARRMPQTARAPRPGRQQKVWITHPEQPETARSRKIADDDCNPSSRHFNVDFPEINVLVTPNTARAAKTPLIVKKYHSQNPDITYLDAD
jgi:hypothetical protein